MMTTVEKRLKEAPRHTGYILTISIIVLTSFIWSLTSINLENVDDKGLTEAPLLIGYILTISIIVLTIFIWSLTSINLENVDEKGLQIAQSIISGIFHPDLSLFNLSKESVPYLLVETLAISFLGTI